MGELVLSYSMLKAWRYCRQMYYYKHVEKLEPKKLPPQFAMGSAVHELLELTRKGQDWTPRLAEMKVEYEALSLDEKEHYGNVPHDAEQIVQGYLKHYKAEDKGIIWRYVEEAFGPYELIPGVVFIAKPDGVIEDTMGHTLLFEMKTGKRLPNDDFRIWNLQTLLYIWALRQAGMKVQGVMWDHVRTKLPTEPRMLKCGEMSRRELDTTYEVYFNALIQNKLNPDDYQDILQQLLKRKDFYARYKLPVKEKMLDIIVNDAKFTASDILEMHNSGTTRGVVRDLSQMKCPRCMYRSLCETVFMDGDVEYVKRSEYCPSSYKPGGGQKEEKDDENEQAPY